MTPNIGGNEVILGEVPEKVSKADPRKYEIVYWNILVFVYYHIAGIYGLCLCITSGRWGTLVLSFINIWLACFGIITGSHRLWSHRSYKATNSLQFFLMLCHSIANQHSVIHWARDHRLHHKYSDTDADPHNASRGFFYSHVGWLFVKKHPEVKAKGKTIDMSDLTSNPILRFQHRNHFWFIPLFAYGLPTVIPMYFWGETFSNAWNINMLRYILNLHQAFTINSFAHMWGYRPYDKHISPAQNQVLFYITLGEGSHNFHHVFPWDYKSDGIGLFNCMTNFIDFCALLGLAYDRKEVDRKTVEARVLRTGDGSVY